MVKAHTISSASRYDHARDREGRRKRSAALRLRPERQPAGSPFPGRRRWEPRELRVRRRQGSRMRIALPGTYSTRQLRCVSGRAANRGTIAAKQASRQSKGICSSVSPARFFANVKKVSDEGLAQENRGQRTAAANFSII